MYSCSISNSRFVSFAKVRSFPDGMAYCGYLSRTIYIWWPAGRVNGGDGQHVLRSEWCWIEATRRPCFLNMHACNKLVWSAPLLLWSLAVQRVCPYDDPYSVALHCPSWFTIPVQIYIYFCCDIFCTPYVVHVWLAGNPWNHSECIHACMSEGSKAELCHICMSLHACWWIDRWIIYISSLLHITWNVHPYYFRKLY